MSLLRLLTSGKSFVGGQDSISRYRVTGRGLVPKFNSKRNPFRATIKPEPTRADFKASQAPAKAETVPIAQVPPGSSDTLPSTPGKEKSEVQGTALRPASGTSLSRAKLGGLIGWCAAKMRGWFARAPKPIQPAIRAFPKTPVQPELSLASVRVVRNDLSDTDLELVPAQTVMQKGTAAAVGIPRQEIAAPKKVKSELQPTTAMSENAEARRS
jgi:hypothetical protein